jgi:hypothetical protein
MADIFTTVLIVPRAPEHVPEVEKLLEELGAAAAQEGPAVGTHAYFKGDDGAYRVIERYAGVEARLEHVKRSRGSAKVGRLAELAEFREPEVLLSESSEELEAALAAFAPAFRRYVTGVL